jgi:TorA maturation chaperone TorD
VELFRALGALVEPPDSASPRLTSLLGLGDPPTAAEHTEVFVLTLPPYASIYLGYDGMLGGDGRDGVAGFWRAIGQRPPREPDHLAPMLGLYAGLAEQASEEPNEERREALGRARDTFLHEHLVSWLPFYLDKLADMAPPTYLAWGRLLDAALLDAMARLDSARRSMTPSVLLGMNTAPPPQGAAGAEEIVSFLLSPARSGMILIRHDLARAAHSLGIGLRAGERRFVLRSLLAQAPDEVLEWLTAEAQAWVDRHEARQASTGAAANVWATRARRAAASIDALRRAARLALAVPSRPE